MGLTPFTSLQRGGILRGMDAWLRTWFRRSPRAFTNAVFAVVVALWATATVGAATRSWAWPVVVLFSAGLLAVLLIAVDELMTLLARPQRVGDGELRRTLVDWLRRQGYGVDEQNGDRLAFKLVAEGPAHQPVTVLKTIDEPVFVRIGTGLAMPPVLREQFAKMPPGDRAEAIDDMRLEMVRLGVAHRGIGVPLIEVQIENAVLAGESLTEEAFFQGVRRIAIAATVLRQQLNRAFRKAQGSTAGEVDALVEAVALDPERFGP